MLACSQVVESLATRIEHPVQRRAGGCAINQDRRVHRGYREHGQQSGIAWNYACGDAALGDRRHHSGDGVGVVDIGHCDGVVGGGGTQSGTDCLGQCDGIGVSAALGDHRAVIGTCDGDGDGLVGDCRSGIGIGGADGVGEHQLLAFSQIIKGVLTGVEGPGHGAAGLDIAQAVIAESHQGQETVIDQREPAMVTAAACNNRQHLGADRVGVIEITQREIACGGEAGRIGLGDGTCGGTQREGRRVVGACYGDDHRLAANGGGGVGVGHTHGVGENQLLAICKVIEFFGTGGEGPGELGGGGRVTEDGGG